jgi:hypothetical protein
MVKARVFISTGQRPGEESNLADRVRNALDAMGFESYVATKNQTLEGINAIIEKLDRSEYFIFIDQYRKGTCREASPYLSLFSHQELAIAFAKGMKDRLIYYRSDAFGKKRREKLEGMSGYLLTNAYTYSSLNDLLRDLKEKVSQKLKQGEWRNDWRNEISISGPPDGEFNFDRRQMFHLVIENHNFMTAAESVAGYMVKYKRGGIENSLNLVELKWAGVTLPLVKVLPQETRRLDAFDLHIEGTNYKLKRSDHADVSDYQMPEIAVLRTETCTVEFIYLVASENFPTKKVRVRIEFKNAERPTYTVEHVD